MGSSFVVFEQSKNATCDDYSDDSYTGSSYTPETEGMTLLPPPEGCQNEGENQLQWNIKI